MRQQARILVAGNLQLDHVAVAPCHEIALNATLRIQHQVPGSTIRRKLLHSVRNHAAEPAKSVLAAYSHAPHPAKVVDSHS